MPRSLTDQREGDSVTKAEVLHVFVAQPLRTASLFHFLLVPML